MDSTNLPPADAFPYIDGERHAEGVSLSAIAEAVGTPFYVYAESALISRYTALADALSGVGSDPLICYALKANSNQAVISTFAGLGAGADVVSVGELERALAAGVPADRIVFAGVGKRRDEMRRALEVGILQFNVESGPEMEALSEVAASMGAVAPIAVRINPDVDAGTHAKITTGRKENKFGVELEPALDLYSRAADLPGIEPVGVAMHIGSQLTELGPFAAAFARLRSFAEELLRRGHGLRHLDFGGGLGIVYHQEAPPTLGAYGELVQRTLAGLSLRPIVEPGRLLVGEAGLLVSRVQYVKQGSVRRFLILDAAMNDLIRPTLYEAYHPIDPVVLREGSGEKQPVDIVGPVCESGDYFAHQRPLMPVRPGDLLAIGSAGAYGSVQASTYNTRPLAAEVMVSGNRFAVIRPRQSIEDVIGLDRQPDWR